MNSLMIKSLVFTVILMLATVGVIMDLDIDIFADSVTSITMFGALAIAGLTSAVSAKYLHQMKTDKASGELSKDSWDGIGEYENELPSGWAYSFLVVFIWSMWYGLVGYPVNAYSQIGEYNEEVLAYNKKFEEKHKNADTDTLRDMGESIFLVQCQQCHGATGDGLSNKAQDFTSRMSEAQVLDVINNGSDKLHYPMGMMPAGMAFGEDAKAIAKYVANGLQGKAPASYASCTSCHGEDSKGNYGTAPNLVEYDATVMKQVMKHGKKGIIGRMPAFNTLITPIQEKALTIYIKSLLSEGE